MAVFCVVLLNRVAAHRLARYHELWLQEISALRQRDTAVRMPVLDAPGSDDNAAVRYRALLAAVWADSERYRPALEPAEAGPCAPVPPEARALLQAHRAELVELHEAVRGRRVDWEFPYELGAEMPLPQSLHPLLLASLIVLEGHERAQAGDANAAAHNYLQAIRFGADLAAAPILKMNQMGTAVAKMGVDNLGALVATCPTVALDTLRVANGLDQIQPKLPSVTSGVRTERRTLAALSKIALAGGGEPGAWNLLTRSPLRAHAIRSLDSMLEEMARAAELEDPREFRRVAEAVLVRAESSRNRHLSGSRMLLRDVVEARTASDELHARFRLLRAAVSLEQHKATQGRYPATLPPQPGLEDPFAWPGTLRYKTNATGSGYTLWSVGPDEKDDGGVLPLDLALQSWPEMSGR